MGKYNLSFLDWLELMEAHYKVQLEAHTKCRYWVGAIRAEAKIEVYKAMQGRFKEIVMKKVK